MYAGILLPLLSEVWGRKEKARFGRYLSRSVEVMFYVVCPLIVGTWLLASDHDPCVWTRFRELWSGTSCSCPRGRDHLYQYDYVSCHCRAQCPT